MTFTRSNISLILGLLSLLACSEPVDKDGKPITHGSFRLRTFPTGAKVWINGQLKVEETPATLVLPRGEYKLKIQHPGAKATEKTITIDPGIRKERTFNIPRPPPASISVFSDLVGASVRVNGYVRGRTPLYNAVTRPGPIDMTVIAPGGQAKSVKTSLGLSENKMVEVHFGDVACQLSDEAVDPENISMPIPEGTVSLAFKPAGEIYDLAGKKLGDSPWLNKVMPVGVHKLRLLSKNGKYERWVKIEVEKNKNHVFRFRLREGDKVED